jgi:phosphopantetheine--protein transferase-like protein
MILVGHDIQDIPEFAGKRSLLATNVFFSPRERAHCAGQRDELASLAGIFCAKEAFAKALSGATALRDFSFGEIEIAHALDGRPRLLLTGRLARWFAEVKAAADVSISHSGGLASATVLLHGER